MSIKKIIQEEMDDFDWARDTHIELMYPPIGLRFTLNPSKEQKPTCHDHIPYTVVDVDEEYIYVSWPDDKGCDVQSISRYEWSRTSYETFIDRIHIIDIIE